MFTSFDEQPSEIEDVSLDERQRLVKGNQDRRQLPWKEGREISVIVYILVIVFSLSSWIAVNGMWVEVPLLVDSLPESWNLPSYLVAIIQTANIGPLLFMVTNSLIPNRLPLASIVYTLMVIGAVACVLQSLFWDRVTDIKGTAHSAALFTLTAFMALVDCTSSVVFLPYMAQFKPPYLTAFYIGEGLTGVLPGLVGLIQGVSSNAKCNNETVINNSSTMSEGNGDDSSGSRFGVSAFFLFLFSIICCSCIAFAVLHHVPYCKKEHIQPSDCEEEQPVHIGSAEASDDDHSTTPINDQHGTVSRRESEDSGPPLAKAQDTRRHKLRHSQYIFLLVITSWINSLQNGILPSIQSYACLPYGSLAYSLTVRLSTLSNPLLCFMALFIQTRSLRIVGLLTLLSTALSCYHLVLAVLSPDPPLKDQATGVTLVIVSGVLLTSSISYVKVINASILSEHDGSKALLWCGAATQIGSCLGAVVMFVVINVLHLLRSGSGC